MTTAKKRNLFDEVREGLEAYRDRRDTLPRRKLLVPHVKAIHEQFGMSQSDMATFLKVASERSEQRESVSPLPLGSAAVEDAL